MRRQGPYVQASVPSFAELAQASTVDRAAALVPLTRRIAAAGRRYNLRAPDVHLMRRISLNAAECAALNTGYDKRTRAIARLLAAMVDTLPAANADLCPYCSLNQNPDLDHFLPKKDFPEYSLFGPNLIPICTPCNRKKLRAIKTPQGGRKLLHAAFEPSIDQPILQASIDYSEDEPVVTYRIDDHVALPPIERAVAIEHFKRLGLAKRYRDRAHGFIASLKQHLTDRSPQVRARTLNRKILDAAVGKPDNDWEAAMFRAVDSNRAPMLEWLGTP